MDFLRLARNGIDKPDVISRLPCDMGFVGKDGGDHPFLFAQGSAEGQEESGGPTRVPVGALSEPGPYEMAGAWDLYKNDPRLGYYPHGDGWEEELFNAGTEDEKPARAEYKDVNTGKVIHDLCPLIEAAIAAKCELRKLYKETHPDPETELVCWTHIANCQRLAYWLDVELRTDGDYSDNELAEKRWGWFRPPFSPRRVSAQARGSRRGHPVSALRRRRPARHRRPGTPARGRNRGTGRAARRRHHGPHLSRGVR